MSQFFSSSSFRLKPKSLKLRTTLRNLNCNLGAYEVLQNCRAASCPNLRFVIIRGIYTRVVFKAPELLQIFEDLLSLVLPNFWKGSGIKNKAFPEISRVSYFTLNV